MTNLDDLELELRRLPGVRSAGFTERDDLLMVQVQVTGDRPPANLPLQATRIAYRHSDKPIALEVVRWRPAEKPDVRVPERADDGETPSVAAVPTPAAEPEPAERRVRLLAVLTFPDTDELEVHLTFEGRRIIGRAVASNGVLGVVEATIDGLRAFAPGVTFTASWANELDQSSEPDLHLVACEVRTTEGGRRNGLASGASPIEAAARATLHALNRTLANELTAAPST
jgi:hypothetical protein